MNKIKIWIGNYIGKDDDYYQYFNEDEYCGFCKDIREDEYDPDFIGIIPLEKNSKSIINLSTLTPLGAKSREQLISDSLSLNINEGNAILFYSGGTREIKIGELFNQLIYIGEYTP